MDMDGSPGLESQMEDAWRRAQESVVVDADFLSVFFTFMNSNGQSATASALGMSVEDVQALLISLISPSTRSWVWRYLPTATKYIV